MNKTSRKFIASSWPDLGPTRRLDPPKTLDVAAEDEPAESLGHAQLVGRQLNDRRPVANYRLLIGGEELPGLFRCVNRRFELVVA
jgi:hypothetical protein